MPVTLSKELRSQLARTTLEARQVAEDAARSALENLAVHEASYRSHMNTEQKKLRNRLWARARALGDYQKEDNTRVIEHLVELVAYEAWHRLLFTRFLTENHLLHTDLEHGSVPVSLQECEELAPELGARDGFELACRFAQQILPGVFRSDDPALELRLSLDDEVALRKLVNSIPAEVFKTDDALGWTYQFWQERRKEAINASGIKIGADELSPVTQLFTEDYMVEFLLHNTLGAWWAGKRGQITASSESEARAKVSLPVKEGLGITWTYLRLTQDGQNKTWKPAAGTFEGWPKTVREITFLDPCMGSGHFLVFAMPILARLRMEEEGISLREAVYATLRDNIHGLELDERCSQIAAFNLALTAWKLGGFQPLPELHLACSGLAPNTSEKKWIDLAGKDDRFRRGMASLYQLFQVAPDLGSLIDPRKVGGDLVEAGFHELLSILNRALANEIGNDSHELTVTARGIAKASELLSRKFILIATNVPYLGRGKQNDTLRDYCEEVHQDAKADLATCMIERCISFSFNASTSALVTPQNWLFQAHYKKLRIKQLRTNQVNFVARLGPGAFETISGEVVKAALVGITNRAPHSEHNICGWDVSDANTPEGKASDLLKTGVHFNQNALLEQSDARVVFGNNTNARLLGDFATALSGMSAGDTMHFDRLFWEVADNGETWEFVQSTVNKNQYYGGRSNIILWEKEAGAIFQLAQSVRHLNHAAQNWLRGKPNWGKSGVVVSQTGDLSVTLYHGDRYDLNCCAIVPNDISLLPAVWTYCSSADFYIAVRNIDQALKVTPQSLLKVPFDFAHWQKVAAEKYPDGLPKPFSSDPTQWLFNGYPKGSDHPLHVAVARLLGYQWPRQTGSSFPECSALKADGLEKYADDDGIVCLPAIHREQAAGHRLRQLLAQALGSYDEKALIKHASPKGSKSSNLEDWLCDEFFEQHCALFHHRPFIWHIWDGRKDGFHALINYHKLDHATLKKLTFTYLGEWITQQEKDTKADKPGAAERLGAARVLQQELEAILEGEAPYDIFVRWKRLDQQAIGWHPDLNDGVRMNIRPFMMAENVGKKGAGILRAKPNIKWDKDRGTEPEANRPKSQFPWFYLDEEPEEVDPKPGPDFIGDRWNYVFLSLEMKRKARKHG